MNLSEIFTQQFDFNELSRFRVDLDQLFSNEADDYAQLLVQHSLALVAALQQIHLDPFALRAALFASSGPNAEAAALVQKHADSETQRLFAAIEQVRQLSVLNASGGSLETLRKLFMALAQDPRVVIILLASRLETCRHHVETKTSPSIVFAQQTLDFFAPLANRLGLWQMKWQLEDLGFRYSDPVEYKKIASLLEERRAEREAFVQAAIERLKALLIENRLQGQVLGRAKHIYSIRNKMRSKNLPFERILDLRALRVLVDTVEQCYAVLSIVQNTWVPIPTEFDDYIAKPKANGYQSLHTIVTVSSGQTIEVQIRTHQMNEFAEFGFAAHWLYKERTTPSTKGAGAAQSGAGGRLTADGQVNQQLSWVRQLLGWQQELGHALIAQAPTKLVDDFIFVMTPEGKVIELPRGATPVDFAYHVHTNLGHRCRGAKINHQMQPLNTVLLNGQTVEIIVAKANDSKGPSRDWLNPELGFLASHRARSKVKNWFNAQALADQIAQGRAVVEKLLQREGKTSLPFEEIAQKLGLDSVEALFSQISRDEIGPRALEHAVRAQPEALSSQSAGGDSVSSEIDSAKAAEQYVAKSGSTSRNRSDVLVVGVDLLLTQLARCCRPIPPDPIVGYVTQGRGISIHRDNCASFKKLKEKQPERVIETSWDSRASKQSPTTDKFAVDISIEAVDRQGLLRDITELLTRRKINVTAVQSLSKRGIALIRMTIEVSGQSALQQALADLHQVKGLVAVKRR